jgi:hypothetical protein
MAKATGKAMTVSQHRLYERHAGHANHLCDLVAKRQMAKVGRLSKGAKYVCHICGRAAAKAASLCEPVAL